ncbi:MAG: exo-alpha-sialidase, partial [Planctomycetota bacterium]
MNRNTLLQSGVPFMVSLCALFCFAFAASAEEAPVQNQGGDLSILREGTESASGSLPCFSGSVVERSPLNEQIHKAREAGDEDLVKRLTPDLPKSTSSEEDVNGSATIPSSSFSGTGDYKNQQSGGLEMQPLPGPNLLAFGNDVHVRGAFHIDMELNPSLVCDSRGYLYAAWQDTALEYDYIQLYRSTDGGKHWDAYAYVANSSAHLQNPCLAVGEGFSNSLLLAYIMDDGVNTPRPEVADKPLDSGSFSIQSVAITSSWEAYREPVIWTDSVQFSGWYAYLTCEGVYSSAAQNINVCTWRSTNQGGSWSSQNVLLGNSDTEAWTDPDGTFGTLGNTVFIVCYNYTDHTLYILSSDDFGATYSAEQAVYTMTSEPIHNVDPEIAAAVGHDHVMICCTCSYNSIDNIGQCYSKDAGATWTTLFNLEGYTANHEYSARLAANEGGVSWHLTYSGDHHVMYSQRYQNLSKYWQGTPDVIDDLQCHSQIYTKKGIASNWDTDECGIVWTDYRDGEPDYDTYFDSTKITVLRVPAQYATIQEAIYWAKDGDTVLVEPGRYMENIDFLGRAITVKSAEGAMWTFINGRQSGSTVTFANGEGEDSIIEGFTICNGSYGGGGGIYCDASSPTIVNNCIVNNWATLGAGIFLYDSSPIITNNTLYHNMASTSGGGLYVKNSNPFVRNTIIWNNTAPSGAGIVNDAGSPSVMYCDVQGGWTGTGNIDSDPLFVDSTVLDLHLLWDSPCRDEGWNGAYGVPDKDHEGDPRIVNGIVDMGADEFHKRFYYAGYPYPGYTITGRLVGVPGTTPVGFWFGGGVLNPPMHSGMYGDFFLMEPWIFFGPFGSIPADGVIDLPTVVPASPAPPYDLYL